MGLGHGPLVLAQRGQTEQHHPRIARIGQALQQALPTNPSMILVTRFLATPRPAAKVVDVR